MSSLGRRFGEEFRRGSAATPAESVARPPLPRRVQLGVLEDPHLDQLAELVLVDVGQRLVVVAGEGLFVVHRPLGRDVEHLELVVGADQHLQAAEQVGPLAAGHRQVVAGDGRAPAAFVDDGLALEAGEVVGQLGEALLDVLGQRQPQPAVQPLALLLAERLGGLGELPLGAGAGATAGGLLQSVSEIHRDSGGVEELLKYSPRRRGE